MASSYINSSTYLTNSNLISSNYLDISYADIANTLSSSAIQSGIYGTNFKDSLLSNISSSTSSYLFNKAGDIGVVTNSKEYYKKQTNKAITDKEAMDLLLLSAK